MFMACFELDLFAWIIVCFLNCNTESSAGICRLFRDIGGHKFALMYVSGNLLTSSQVTLFNVSRMYCKCYFMDV